MGHACSSVISTLKHCLVLGVCPASARGLASKSLAAVPLRLVSAAQSAPGALVDGVQQAIFQVLTSDQVGIPAELKHINKRRKRNQPGLP